MFPELHCIINIMHADMLVQDNLITGVGWDGGLLGETACRRGLKWTQNISF